MITIIIIRKILAYFNQHGTRHKNKEYNKIIINLEDIMEAI